MNGDNGFYFEKLGLKKKRERTGTALWLEGNINSKETYGMFGLVLLCVPKSKLLLGETDARERV